MMGVLPIWEAVGTVVENCRTDEKRRVRRSMGASVVCEAMLICGVLQQLFSVRSSNDKAAN